MKIQYVMVPLLSLLQACSHGPQTAASQDYGRLLIAERYENQSPVNTCSIPIPAPGPFIQTYPLREQGCKINSDYFSMNSVASAVHVWFYDHIDCEDVPDFPLLPDYQNNWTLHVEVIKNPTTTRWVKVTEVRDTSVRGIVVPGVQLIDVEVIPRFPPVWEHNLSCVRILHPY